MRPVKGIITGQKGSTLVIKLESGKTIHTQKKAGLKIGKPVIVFYDFTEAKVREVRLEVKNEHQLEIAVIERESEPEVLIGEMYEIAPLVLDSGALQPSCEGCWEFYDPDFTKLETPEFEE